MSVLTTGIPATFNTKVNELKIDCKKILVEYFSSIAGILFLILLDLRIIHLRTIKKMFIKTFEVKLKRLVKMVMIWT